MTVFHCGIGISEARFPVLRRRHIVIEGGAEEFSPVDLLLAGLEIELDIRGVGEFEESLLSLVLLRVLPAFGIRPERVTFLEIGRIDLLLQFGHLLQFGRVQHLHVILVKGGTVDHIEHPQFAGFESLLKAADLLEVFALLELQESLEGLVLKGVFVAFDAE